ncbi:MAG: hypothetical protein N2645_03765 [Clostridia bacterium]|nr:hypothetical protein [Clostridia bacterium]
MDNIKYGMVKGYLLALSTIKFEQYISYDFLFEEIDLTVTETDIQKVFETYVKNNYSDLDQILIETTEIIEVENWNEKVFEDHLHEFDFDKKCVAKLFSLINDFFDNDIKVWKIRSGVRLAAYQEMYVFKKDMDFYIFQACQDD